MDNEQIRKLAHDAYRLGVLDTILHPDVAAALKSPGVITASYEGEREYRLHCLGLDNIDIEHRIST